MSSASFKVDQDLMLWPGLRMIRGTVKGSANYQSGDTMDVSNYFKASTYPTVITSPGPYSFKSDHGAANVLKLLAYQQNGAAAAGAPLELVAAATDTSGTNVPFVAFGQPY